MTVFETRGINGDDKLICSGDWNSIVSTTLDKSGGTSVQDNIVPQMKSLLEMLDIIDVWRIRYPESKQFTFRQNTLLVQLIISW